ncbi:cytochrome oxidase assembly protein-domain-containing protein [Kalaharituber pfeilii]|nr:cytochrome oxidase assembly protein-domain-containing protein [Kalaharituber pfeilii]
MEAIGNNIKVINTPEITQDEPKQKAWFKDTSEKVVGYWLLGSAGLVFGIVVFGGLTRLTESGLSITEWKPVTGAIPPMTQVDWEENFAKYKDSPEYRILNPHMTLEEFKSIYYMEWAHRLWGRVIGLSFVIPAAYFIVRGHVSQTMALKLCGISALIGFQGFIGWWMVKSGLKDDLFTTPGNTVPRVSQYRLTAHLCAAFTVYLAMLHNGLAILRQHRLLSNPSQGIAELKLLSNHQLRFLRRSVLGLAILAFITAMSGGLVAGLDAGLIYNEFPLMGTGFKPPNSELFNPFYARDKEGYSDLWWRNMLENPSTVQFEHRCLAMTTFSAILAFWLFARFGHVSGGVKAWSLLDKKMRSGIHGILHLALLQVTLGISTLIYMVPTPIAAAHQAGSLALLTGIFVLASRVSPASKRVAGLVGKRMAEATGTAGWVGLSAVNATPPASASYAAMARASAAASTAVKEAAKSVPKQGPRIHWQGGKSKA